VDRLLEILGEIEWWGCQRRAGYAAGGDRSAHRA